MSYCRFSCDDFKSDLYVYARVDGLWVVHVAGRRWTAHPDDGPSLVLLDDDGNVANSGHPTKETWDARCAWIESVMVDIDLPHATEMFTLDSPGAAADKVEWLLAIGYHCPSDVVPTLREEQRDIDRDSDPRPQSGDQE